MSKKQGVIAHVKDSYLSSSETFIYERLKNIRRFKGYVLTDRKMKNLQKFPYKPIYHMKKRNVTKLLKKKKTSLIHAYFGSGAIRILPYKKKTKIPLVTSFHGVDVSARLMKKGYKKKLRQVFAQSKIVFAVSDYMKRRLIKLGCPAQKIKVIRTGIDLQKFPFHPKKAPGKKQVIHILSVGRLVEKKGMDVLVRAFAKVHKKFPRTRLTIIGKGKKKSELKKWICRLSLRKVVKLKGERSHSEVQKAMRKADLFVLASRTAKNKDQEGIPNALVEAMATGVPVVATTHSGIPELIQHKKSGLLAREGSVADLAKQMKKMITMKNGWPKMERVARKKVEKVHDIRKQVRKAEKLYARVIKGELIVLPLSLFGIKKADIPVCKRRYRAKKFTFLRNRVSIVIVLDKALLDLFFSFHIAW